MIQTLSILEITRNWNPHQLAMVQTILGSIKLFLRLLCAKDTSVKWFWGQTLHPLLFRNVTRTLSMFWTGSQESHLGAEFHKAIAVANLSQNIYDLGMAITKVCESTHLENVKLLFSQFLTFLLENPLVILDSHISP